MKSFIETTLMVTQYFYRKSVSIGENKFATAVVEVVTTILFRENKNLLFQFFIDLYRAKYFNQISMIQR